MLKQEFFRAIEVSEISILKKAQSFLLKSQWDIILENPLLFNLDYLDCMISRLSLSPNSEAGCEQSNSKYNRAKNKQSSSMGLDMIRARMRVGSNELPTHLFKTKEQVKYWKKKWAPTGRESFRKKL